MFSTFKMSINEKRPLQEKSNYFPVSKIRLIWQNTYLLIAQLKILYNLEKH